MVERVALHADTHGGLREGRREGCRLRRLMSSDSAPAWRDASESDRGSGGTNETVLRRLWDEIGVLEWRFWGENEGLGRNGTIWDGFGHVQSVPFGIFCCKLFIYNYLSKSD